jgi:hypothetical protein
MSLSVDAEGPHVMVLGSMRTFLHRGGEKVKLAKGAPPLPLREGDELRLHAEHCLLFRVCAGSASQAPVSSGPASAEAPAEALPSLVSPSLKRDSAQRDASQPEEPPAKRRAPDAATAGGPAAALPGVGTRPPSSPAPPSSPLLTCVICCTERPAQQGLRCASGHFVCCGGPEGEPSCAEAHAASTLADPQRVLASGSLHCPLARAGRCAPAGRSFRERVARGVETDAPLVPFHQLHRTPLQLGAAHPVPAPLGVRYDAGRAARGGRCAGGGEGATGG